MLAGEHISSDDEPLCTDPTAPTQASLGEDESLRKKLASLEARNAALTITLRKVSTKLSLELFTCTCATSGQRVSITQYVLSLQLETYTMSVVGCGLLWLILVLCDRFQR